MSFIIRSNGLLFRLACRAPRWLVPACYAVRVGQDMTTFSRVHLFVDREPRF